MIRKIDVQADYLYPFDPTSLARRGLSSTLAREATRVVESYSTRVELE